MAADMLQRFPIVQDAAARFADGNASQWELDDAVLTALAEF